MLATMPSKAPDIFTFQVHEIKFAKDGFHIIRTTRGDSVSGKFAAIVGHCYKAEGHWKRDPKWGEQYTLDSAVSVKMTTPEALGRFLVYKMKGHSVGEAVISLLVDGVKAEGLDLEDLLDRHQLDLMVEFVGKRNAKKIEAILEMWPKIKPGADLMSPLLGYGLTTAMAETLISLYGNRVLKQVEDHPYDLILDVDGVSFITADKIAMKVGKISHTDPIRLRAAFATGMKDATSNGDIGVRRSQLITKTLPLVNESVLENGRRKLAPGVPLQVPQEMLTKVLNDMVAGLYLDASGDECGFSSRLIEFPDDAGEMVVWYKPLVEAEQTIARRLTLFKAKPRLDLVARVAEFAAKAGVTPSEGQLEAMVMVLSNPVSVITGGPGCGKSFILKLLLEMLDSVGFRGDLAAPTGKAAKRITESTGRRAQTLHSLVGFGGGTETAFNEACPLAAHYLVIDEESMVDTELMAATLCAASNNCRIIMVGDVDQLASVGPGQVLRDIIRSGVVPVTRLTKGFRFGGGIAEAARTINSGHTPESSEDGQFVVVDTDYPAQDLIAAVKELVASGVNPDDIQVLAPTHKGDAGTINLNKLMQAFLNPEPVGGTNQRLRRDSGDIRVGDRVMQNKNDKALLLVNGDIGWVDEIASDSGNVVYSLPDKDQPVHMSSAQAVNLRLAYTISVHKSQGGEAPYVLMALDAAASFMLRRNLVYTGVTRGSKKVMLFSSRSTLSNACHRGEKAEGSRRTSLVSKLKAAFPLVVPAKVPDSLAEAMLFKTEDVPF